MDPVSGLCTGCCRTLDEIESVTGRRIAYIGNHVALINGSLRDNLFYGLRNRLVRADEPVDDEARAARERYIFEASMSGNTSSDPGGDWIDYAMYNLSGPEDLMARALDTLRLVDLEADLFGLGLKGTVDPGSLQALRECQAADAAADDQDIEWLGHLTLL